MASEANTSVVKDEARWFSEKSTLWPGQAMSIEVEGIIKDVKSEFQHLQVYQTKTYGKMLVLDGCIQFTERDEFAYQEMMAHVALMVHKNPEKVLVVGGGDGGVVREIVKHDLVKSVTLCEIDKTVVDVCKEIFPNMTSGLDNPKVNVVIEDGFKFLKNNQNTFDIIITDSSDPVGPAASLFQKDYFTLLNSSLRSGGIIVSQAECQWLHLDFICDVIGYCKSVFKVVEYGFVSLPTYPCGQLGFVVCSNTDYDVKAPQREITEELQNKLRYYNGDVHRASFVLPQFARVALQKVVPK